MQDLGAENSGRANSERRAPRQERAWHKQGTVARKRRSRGRREEERRPRGNGPQSTEPEGP